MKYELTVHDDGMTAVRRCKKYGPYGLYIQLKSFVDLVQYLREWIQPRLSISELRKMLKDAQIGEWVEFK